MGGVLGLAALVALAPYDVPSWLPEVLERLARHAQQPQPIKAAVSRVFADFKRTHQAPPTNADNWAASRKRLTPEQLEMLADAEQPPHWYA
uniref:Proteasome activator complex subunit 4 C-terminal domain-containing protein n=1 Tax=Emiliania huxleyi (strain CCMP1516) TaxID=280463 RepID=A0A0D3IX08_EMIH1